MWTTLQRFGQLTVLSIRIREIGSEKSLEALFQVVATIGTLISLNLATSSCPRHPISDVFCSLTNLRSLSLLISARGKPTRVSVRVSRLTHLTSLALEGVSIQGSIAPLGELACLSLANLAPASGDLSSALTQLAKLNRVVVE